MFTYFLYYLLILNLITFLVYGIDKWKARTNQWRIPESTLLLLALFGGSIGAIMGMEIWRHKTQHLIFRIGVPLMLILQLTLALWLAFDK